MGVKRSYNRKTNEIRHTMWNEESLRSFKGLRELGVKDGLAQHRYFGMTDFHTGYSLSLTHYCHIVIALVINQMIVYHLPKY